MSVTDLGHLRPNGKDKAMEVTRDERWEHFYRINKDEKTADSMWRFEVRMNKIKAEKAAKSTKLLTEPPKIVAAPTKYLKKCQATTMSGKACPFRAISECGRFCKKHILK